MAAANRHRVLFLTCLLSTAAGCTPDETDDSAETSAPATQLATATAVGMNLLAAKPQTKKSNYGAPTSVTPFR